MFFHSQVIAFRERGGKCWFVLTSKCLQPHGSPEHPYIALRVRRARRVMRRGLMRGMKQGENFGDATVAFPKPPGQRRLTDMAL